MSRGAFVATAGNNQVTVTVDPDQSVAETSYADNSRSFTFNAVSWIEALGFCGVGEFGDWVEGGSKIGPGGALPLNTSGGHLAEGRLHGLSLFTEAVLQLRGQCGPRQVPDAKVAAVASIQTCAMLLRADD